MAGETHTDTIAQRQEANRIGSRRANFSSKRQSLIAALWSVRTPVESAGGDGRTSRSRPQPAHQSCGGPECKLGKK